VVFDSILDKQCVSSKAMERTAGDMELGAIVYVWKLAPWLCLMSLKKNM